MVRSIVSSGDLDSVAISDEQSACVPARHDTAGLPVSYPLAGVNRAEPPLSSPPYRPLIRYYRYYILRSTLSSSPLASSSASSPPAVSRVTAAPLHAYGLDSATQPVNEHVTTARVQGTDCERAPLCLWAVLSRGNRPIVYVRVIRTRCQTK